MTVARKRKNPRMIPRETRRTDAAARTAREESMTAEERDLATIALYGHLPLCCTPLDLARSVAEQWLDLVDEPSPEDYEEELFAASSRQYTRVTGRTITRDVAHDVIEPNHEEH